MIEIKDGAKFSDQQDSITLQELIDANNESIDYVLNLIKDLPDEVVTFQPVDENAYDPYSETRDVRYVAWTLGHVIVHMTASAEESAARSSMLARGVHLEQRLRYETPWEIVTTIQELVDRLEESRKIRNAYFNAWPNTPFLDVTYDKSEKYWGRINAFGMGISGLKHDYDHYGQLKDIIAQFKEAQSVTAE